MRILALGLAAVLTLSAPLHADQPDRQITVTGEGVVEAAPDMATVSLGVVSEARTAAAALRANSEDMAAILARLTEAGIADRDMQTSGLSVNPRWDNRSTSGGRPQITGFVASNQLTVRVRDLAALGGLLDSLVGEGANTLGGVGFGLQEPRPLQDEARRRAVSDARARAGLYTEAAGVTLGEVISIDEMGGGVPRPQALGRMEMALSADAVPVAGGELSLRAQVRMVFALADN
ncbi:MAG: SIMPL domain-containing protein [Alphaproteobacteria bacterium]|nr:SIMPL domain-containing protein [Alphaproteobacteria bacterium]NNF25343.1 SIMPL domain-containing protein [Paracoccaceae bacterium]